MKQRKSKGFTLVELLIVIIIIGILAGMMMLSTGAATDKAEATKIISNLRNAKAACIMYYADNSAYPVKGTSESSLDKYLDAGLFNTNNGKIGYATYTIETKNYSGNTRTVVQAAVNSSASGIRDKLDIAANSGGSVLSKDSSGNYWMRVN